MAPRVKDQIHTALFSLAVLAIAAAAGVLWQLKVDFGEFRGEVRARLINLESMGRFARGK